jgi:hypothetical protein
MFLFGSHVSTSSDGILEGNTVMIYRCPKILLDQILHSSFGGIYFHDVQWRPVQSWQAEKKLAARRTLKSTRCDIDSFSARLTSTTVKMYVFAIQCVTHCRTALIYMLHSSHSSFLPYTLSYVISPSVLVLVPFPRFIVVEGQRNGTQTGIWFEQLESPPGPEFQPLTAAIKLNARSFVTRRQS